MNSMHEPKISMNDSSTLAFVIASLASQAINTEELRDWADYILATVGDAPPYTLELSSFDGYLKDVYGVVGFVPDREFSTEVQAAMAGIAFRRGKDPYDCEWSREQALDSLSQQPEVLDEFKATFPFIEF